MAITFWEIWTGKDPFAQENTFSIYQLIVQGTRPDIPSSCPEGFRDVINEAWNTTALKRPTALSIAKKMNDVIEDYQDASAAALLLSHSMSSTKVQNMEMMGSTHISSKNENNSKEDAPGGGVKYSPISDVNVDISFQYDDMYNADHTDGTTRSESESHANPLKGLFRKSSQKK